LAIENVHEKIMMVTLVISPLLGRNILNWNLLSSFRLQILFYLISFIFVAMAMTTLKVAEVANVLARLEFDRRRLNRELDALGEIDFQALENRFNMGIVNYRTLIETVLDSWVQNHASQATIGVVCEALKYNEGQLASGWSTESH
jgi:hypothetical protein